MIKQIAKLFLKKNLDLRAEIARAELDAAQARAEAVKSRAESIKDKANTASKLAADSDTDKKAQSKHYDSIWLQQLAAKTEKDIAKANEEVSRKN